MKDALRARLADAVDTLSQIDALVEADAGRLPSILLARALVRLDSIPARLARMRQALADARGDPPGGSAPWKAPAGG